MQTRNDIPSNITAPPVRTISGGIIKKPKRHLENVEQLVKYLTIEQIEFFQKQKIELNKLSYFLNKQKKETVCDIYF